MFFVAGSYSPLDQDCLVFVKLLTVLLVQSFTNTRQARLPDGYVIWLLIRRGKSLKIAKIMILYAEE